MGIARIGGWVVARAGRARRVHNGWLPLQQRAYRAAFLIAFAAAPLAAGDVTFDPTITRDEFREFSLTAGQAIFASPVDPARARGILGFDIGIAANGVKVDTSSPFWRKAVDAGIASNGYLIVPRLVVSKGFGGGNISLSYAKFGNSKAKSYGGSLDLPIVNGGLIRPTLAARGTYADLRGIDVYRLKTYGLEVFLSKGIGPVTPYIAAGTMRTNAHGTVPSNVTSVPDLVLDDKSNVKRYTAGFRFSLLLPKISVEATQAKQRSYAAKVSFGF
jgi:hypothetical protein